MINSLCLSWFHRQNNNLWHKYPELWDKCLIDRAYSNMLHAQTSAYLAVKLFKFIFEFNFHWLGHSPNFLLQYLDQSNIFSTLQLHFLSSPYLPITASSHHPLNNFLLLLDQKFKSTVDFSAFLYIPVQHAFWLDYTDWWTTWNQVVSSSVLLPISPEVVFIPSVKTAMSAESTKGIKFYFILLENYLEANGDIPLLFALQVFDPLEKPHPLSGGLASLHTQHYMKEYLNWRLVLKMPRKESFPHISPSSQCLIWFF